MYLCVLEKMTTLRACSEYLGKQIVNAEGDNVKVNNVRQLLDEQVEDVPWVERLFIALEAAKGLSYLHQAGCVHCDLKSSNVFIGGAVEKMDVKIGDFGESILDAKEVVTTQMSSQDPSRGGGGGGGTMSFVAPEILKGEKPTKLSDIYSFGMFLVELLEPGWNNPWDGVCRPMMIPSEDLANERPTLPSHRDGLLPDILENYNDLIRKCWVENPVDRPNSASIVREIEIIITKLPQTKHCHDKMTITTNSVAEGGEFQFLENTEDIEHHILQLSIYQGTAIEAVGEITASCAREGTKFDSDVTADISAQAQLLDGTNACVFNSIAIAEWFKKNEENTQLPFNRNVMKKAVEKIILSIPQLINDTRNISSMYTVERILSAKDILGCSLLSEQVMASIPGITTTEGKESLRQALNILHQQRPAQAVCTCPPYSFFIGRGQPVFNREFNDS